jgi:thioredoxin-dependent peroxiredoxin
MTIPSEGTKAPQFTLTNENEEKRTLASYKGKWLILYFYPKDNTSGCTVEAVEFTQLQKKFQKLDAQVVGVSPDSCKSHRNFITRKELTVELLSDPEHTMLQDYGVWQKKKMYGKEYFGVVRTTFLVDPQGTIEKVWLKVKAKGHGEEVLNYLTSLSSEKK